MNFKEIDVPAPWGNIAVRLWGTDSNSPVLMFHGILDNVGSFDAIIPLLPKNYCYICVDLPGHGKSSHWPSKSIINSLDNLLAYEVIAKYFKREKYIILGHSYGGQLGYFYTQLYPHRVIKLIMLDVICLVPLPCDKIKSKLASIHKSYFKTMDKIQNEEPPEYTYEEALSRIIDSRRRSGLNEKTVKPIMDRMIIPRANGKVSFSFDQRLKFPLHTLFDQNAMYTFIKTFPVECPVLIILCTETMKTHNKLYKETIELYRSRNNMKISIVEGTHNVHNIHPERIVPLISSFLLNNSKL